MNTAIIIRASVFPKKGVEVLFEKQIEVSLDCSQCVRTDRTVVFQTLDEPGLCHPSRHEFSGQIIEFSTNEKSGLFGREFECEFRLDYEYTPIEDAKYPQRVSSALPTWGRVHFKVKCPRCGSVSAESIQNNIVRPYMNVCECGYKLYKLKTEYPSFSYNA